jgi:hypothetical protein
MSDIVERLSESKVVHFNLYRPENSVFKAAKNDKAQIQIVTCSMFDNCQLLDRGECAAQRVLGGGCPYGRRSVETGYTRRAMKYREWCSQQKQKYDGVPFLDRPKVLSVVGEYVFLPYLYMDHLKSVEWVHGGFVKRADFTEDLVIALANLRPRQILGYREITSYQKEEVPKFLLHLSEQMPDLYAAVVEADEHCRSVAAGLSHVGRTAILQTTTPGAAKFKDIHGGLWEWDGRQLRSNNSRMSFGLCKFSSVSLTPEPYQEVKITDESQVNDSTVFLD